MFEKFFVVVKYNDLFLLKISIQQEDYFRNNKQIKFFQRMKFYEKFVVKL